MEDMKLVKRIMDWNNIGVKTKGWPNKSWRDEVINDLKKLKLRNGSQIVKDWKVLNDVVQNNKNTCKVVVEEEEEEEKKEEEEEEEKKKKKKSLWLNYLLSYLLNAFKQSIIY